MRFVHVNHRYSPFVGGSERYMQEVSQSLARDGHDVSVVTSDAFDLEYFWDKGRESVSAPACERIGGVWVERVPVQHIPVNPLIFQASRRAMGELSRLPLPSAPFEYASTRLPRMPGIGKSLSSHGQADLVHAANLGLEGVAIHAARSAETMGCPFVLTPFIHLGVADNPVARRYVSMPHQRKLLQAARSIVVMTQLEASFVESLGIDANKIHVSGVGINASEVSGGDPERFRERFGLTGSLVGVASAVAFDKGSRELVLAVGDLRRRGYDVQLVLAGPRLRQFDRWYAGLSEKDTDGIHLLGFISAEDKRDMLAALDILTMPSRTESFGIAYLEGWANGIPVVAANAGAVPELVVDGVNGKLVEFGDVRGVSSAIADLLSNKAAATALGSAGSALTLSRYTWPLVLERVKAAYSSALGFDIGRSGAN